MDEQNALFMALKDEHAALVKEHSRLDSINDGLEAEHQREAILKENLIGAISELEAQREASEEKP